MQSEIVQKLPTEEERLTFVRQQFTVADDAIKELAAAYSGLTVGGLDDREGLNRVHEARMHVKGLRVDVEKKRKELKEDALAWGRMVDGEAKRLTGLLSPIEERLAGEEERIATERKWLAEEARKAKEARFTDRLKRLLALNADVSASTQILEEDDDAFELRLDVARVEKAKADALAEEAARVEAARKAEADRLAAEERERRRLEAERAAEEAARVAREKALADEAALKAERKARAQVEQELAAAREAERKAREAAEEAQRHYQAEIERAEAERKAELARQRELEASATARGTTEPLCAKPSGAPAEPEQSGDAPEGPFPFRPRTTLAWAAVEADGRIHIQTVRETEIDADNARRLYAAFEAVIVQVEIREAAYQP